MPIRFAFRPRLLDSLHGYGRGEFARDVGAGLTVGIVALPLAMAFAIASGLKPEAGLISAIIAGFLISALGGSKVQIGGPAGAFIVIVYGIVERYGLANLLIAAAMSGVMLFVLGLFRLGVLVRFVPVAVLIGFTNGIAVLILLSQIRDFFGLRAPPMPADFFSLLAALWRAAPSLHPPSLMMAVLCLAAILLWDRSRTGWALWPKAIAWLRHVPGSIVALTAASVAAHALTLSVDTVGSRFGGIPATLPSFALPTFDWATVKYLLVPASTLALLGAIESLLCARIADNMTQERHDPNQELMAQGIANLVTPFFGGMPSTGTVARTVTNIKSGARSPVAGMVHALTVLAVLLVAAPLASAVPMACLSAILVNVAWNMGQWREFLHLRQFRMPYRFTLLAVFFLTVVVDLTVALEVGLFAACVTFIYRISSLSRCEPLAQPDASVSVYRMYGALFFGAVKQVEAMGGNLPKRALMIDLKNVIYIDSSGADTLAALARRCSGAGVRLLLCGLNHQPLDIARRCGLLDVLGNDAQHPDLASALAALGGINPTAQGSLTFARE